MTGTFEPINDATQLQVDPGHGRVYEFGWQSWSPSTVYPVSAGRGFRPTDEVFLMPYYRRERPPTTASFQGEGLLAVEPAPGEPVHVVALRDGRAEVATIRATYRDGVVGLSADGPVDHTVDDGPGLLPPGSGTAVVHGSLCPLGAVIKQSAATPELMKHRGRAVVFDDVEEYQKAAEDPALDVTADSVLVVRNAGPRGYPGMPEIGNLPIPVRLLEEGVTDMVRISDARMSGTSYGTVVLHVAPESAVGGPLALVRNGDPIVLDVPERRLDLEVDDAELDQRLRDWSPPPVRHDRGWSRLHVDHVLQADQGADLDFLAGSSGHAVPRTPF